MDLPVEHLRTIASIIDEGSLEGAARALHVTPSAVSQRLRQLEERVGAVLLNRTRPVTVTASGAPVLRAARQIARIVDDVTMELSPGAGREALVQLVINADSLATWFVPALARAAAETGARFEVLRADETVSTEKLRSGEVMAAVTATAEAVPGCVSTKLGVDRYHAVASPAFAAEYFTSGVSATSLATAPHIDFDRHDMFQRRFIEQFGNTAALPPRHFVPSSFEFAVAVEMGMGWGMLPHVQCSKLIASGALVDISPEHAIELPLYWQRWNLLSPVLDTLTEIITEEAQRALNRDSSEYSARALRSIPVARRMPPL